MKESENSSINNQDYGHMDKEMKLEGLQVGAPMDTSQVEVNGEVKEEERKKRRYFTVGYKLQVLRQADLCRGKPGALGALLRREGVFSSLLTYWRKQRDSGELSALSTKRGRKPKYTASDIEIEQWKKRYHRVREEYNQALIIIQAQKKISEILGAKQVDTSHLEEFED